jgi:MFS transporter, ACS family, hexuronate transporter
VRMLGDPTDPGSGEFAWLLFCRTMLGLFEAGHWPCALITARNILSDSDRPMGNSILQSGASLGAVLTPLVIQAFREFGAPWQMPFVVIGAIGIFWVPLWRRLIGPSDLQARTPAVFQTSRPVSPVRLAAQFLCLIVIVVTISMAWQFQRAWLPKYLKEHHEYSEATANYFTSGYYIVADVGCLFFGAVVSVLTRRQVPVRFARLVSFGMCAALMALSALVPAMERGPLLLATIVAAGAGALGAHPQYYALAQELPARHMGFLSGVLSAASWVAVGQMQDIMGDHIERMNAIDPARSYNFPLTVIGFAPLAGLLAMGAWVVLTRRIGRGPNSAEPNHA